MSGEESCLYGSAKDVNLNKSAVNRQDLFDKKNAYKNFIRQKGRRYEFEEMKKIENLRHEKPKEFWRLFKKSKSPTGKNITTEDFCSYFKKLAQEINVNNEWAEHFDSDNDFDQTDPIYED